MKVTYPPDEKIDSYETLDLESETEHYATYEAPDNDFLVKRVVVSKQYWNESGRQAPRRLVVSTAGED